MMRKYNNKAFSLVEVMIVLIVIGILIGFLFPSIQNAREEALQRKCANNLQQIGAALILYAKDHNGAFPDPVNSTNDDWAYQYASILVGQNYLPDNNELFDCPGSPHQGTKNDPDYWYGNTMSEYDEAGSATGANSDYPYTIYSPGWRQLCGCHNLGAPDYIQPHSGGLNYVTIAGRVYWEKGD
jgi:prepilin-type N-terminal cleavage/methylation domain-containing protein